MAPRILNLLTVCWTVSNSTPHSEGRHGLHWIGCGMEPRGGFASGDKGRLFACRDPNHGLTDSRQSVCTKIFLFDTYPANVEKMVSS